MYTGIWLDILGIISSAVIYEPADHMYLDGFSKLKPWFEKNYYGGGFNRNLGIVGFLPFWSTQGSTRCLPDGLVPSKGSYGYNFFESEKYWQVINFLFSDKRVVQNGPTIITENEIRDFVKFQHTKCYQ